MVEHIEYIEDDNTKPEKKTIIEYAHTMNQYSFLVLAWIGIILGLGSNNKYFFLITAIMFTLYFLSMMCVASHIIRTRMKK